MFGGFCRGVFGYGLGGSYPFFMFFMMMSFVLVLMLGIYFIFKRSAFKSNKDDVLEILNKKLASGEISEEEYFRKKEIIYKK